jgi:hypothetical protein
MKWAKKGITNYWEYFLKIETHISGERVQSFQQTTLFPALRSKFKYEIVNQPRL